MEEKNRRTFLRFLAISIAALFAFIWNKLTLTHINQLEQKVSIFPFNKNKPITFVENYIIINQNEKTNVFSAFCSHLGCIINKTEKGRLVCPCHGSEYDMDGNVVKGPSYKNLNKIPSKITSDGTHIEIGG